MSWSHIQNHIANGEKSDLKRYEEHYALLQ